MSKTDQIANRCVKIGAKACALTDHGSIAGSIKFYKSCKAKNIKPILGCELYVCKQDPTIQDNSNKDLCHFLVLCKNLQGWKDLIKIVSTSNLPENFYYKPRLDFESIKKLNTGNLIGITGHLGSSLADEIVGDYVKLKEDWLELGIKHVEYLKTIFGDQLFLEAQLIDKDNLPIQIDLTNAIREIGKKTGVRVICTPDAHYSERSDCEDQRILLCNNLKTTFSEISDKLSRGEDVPLGCFFKSDCYHIPSQEEIEALHTKEEIENTNFVNDMVEEYSILSKPRLPKFPCPEGFDEDEYLRQLCREGWKKKIQNKIPKDKHQIYIDRIKSELDVLQGAGLSSYFLIVGDVLDFVRRSGWLPSTGRGSAAGCLVSYLIGITQVDPIKYGLLFERFFNPARADSMPDIDVDVPIEKREFVIKYIKDKYGHNNVSQMITFNTIKGRAALKDVLRVYGNVSFEEMNKITKNIPEESKISDELQAMKEETGEASIIGWSLENVSDQLRDYCFYNDDGILEGPLAKRFEQAIRLEGTKSNQSKHAAGIAISSDPLAEICPMIYDSKNKQLIAGMEMQDLEAIGVIKLDILGIAYLDKIMDIQETLLETEITNENCII